MKIRRLNSGIMIIILGAISFLATLSLFKFPQFFSDPSAFGFTLLESIISLVVLLGLCLISARIILWAYSKIQVPQRPRQVLAYGFLISVLSFLLSMWLGFQQYRLLLSKIPHDIVEFPLFRGYINFLPHGFEPVVFACAISTVILLWVARWRNRTEISTISSGTRTKQDIILGISTLVIFVFFITRILKFIMMTLTVWAIGRG